MRFILGLVWSRPAAEADGSDMFMRRLDRVASERARPSARGMAGGRSWRLLKRSGSASTA
jgi:hypothetical protein